MLLFIKEYTALQADKDKDKDDSIKSVLKQLIRNNLFASEDRIDLIKDSYIVKMDGFPKDGPIAKAIVYFIVSKLNTIYEKLPKQVVDEDSVELRHFTIIDEAHYMLGFDNKPLRDLIAVGRNKGGPIRLELDCFDDVEPGGNFDHPLDVIDRGRFVKAIFLTERRRGRLAVGATLRAAAPHQILRRKRRL